MPGPETPPLTLDPQTLDEELVQETMKWMTSKSTEDLKNILTEATHRPETYAPEIIEATQRILANRKKLTHTPIIGKRFTQLSKQQVEIKLPEQEPFTFKSHEDLQTAILDGHIPIDTLVRPIEKKSEKSPTEETLSEAQWIPLQTHEKFSALYTPVLYSLKWGVILGIYLAFGIFSGQFRILPFLHSFNKHSFVLIDDLLVSLFILFGLMALVFWDGIEKKVWFSNIKFALSTLILFGVFFMVGSIFLGLAVWEEWDFRKFLLEVFWLSGILINAIIFGGPLGAMLGTGVGYVRSNFFPKAPNTKKEGLRIYRLGLIYPTLFILITWPLAYFWLFP
ncbi:MAG: hypothetical protein OEY26_11380 [Nitrospinota bacterium]|nr:hypothetical protein [Nitrospinota bacterium]